MKYACALILCISAAFVAHAGLLTGKITDTKGATLPYATVYVEGTTTGTTANSDGVYELPLPAGQYTIKCVYTGFKQAAFSVRVEGDEKLHHDFVLTDLAQEMHEVVIHASEEDPAYAIIRKAIARRKFHEEQVKTFETDLYLKGVGRTRSVPRQIMGQKLSTANTGLDTAGKGIFYLAEENATYYSENNKTKTIIHSVHESGDERGLGFAHIPNVIGFYENNINLLGNESRGFISPISASALSYYKYKLIGEFAEQGKTIYKIAVTQKRDYEPCFNGTIYIADSDWAIQSLDMTLAKKSGMDIFDTIKINQEYLPASPELWLIKSQVIYLTINIFGIDATFNLVTVYNNQQVNRDIPDTVFNKRITTFYDSSANKKDTSFWTQARPVPLQKDEQRDFGVKDSIRKVMNSPAYQDSLRKKRQRRFSVIDLFVGNASVYHDSSNAVFLNPLILGIGEDNIVNYNIVEGVDVAPKTSWQHRIDSSKALHADAALRYGFSNRHFNAIARLYKTVQDRSWHGRTWTYGLQGGKYVFQYNPVNPIIPLFNSATALLFRQNDLKIYERVDMTAFVRRAYGNGLRWFVKASYQQRLPLDTTTNFSFASERHFRFNNDEPDHLLQAATAWEKHDAVILHGSVAYQPGITYTQYPDYRAAVMSTKPLFRLAYDKGIPDILNSKVDYDRWRLSMEGNVRLRLAGNLSYNIACGGFLNATYVSIPDLMHLFGDRGIGLASPYLQSFQFAQFYDFSNKEPLYGEAHLEYFLNGLLSNKIPLLKQAQWHLVVGTNSFYARQNDYYTEAFIGIDNIGWKFFRLLRIDFVQSWDSYGGRNSGFRIGLKSITGNVERVGETTGEW
jgi:Family of unknown function (DUF5686)/CarboxypepD_reg-like domain